MITQKILFGIISFLAYIIIWSKCKSSLNFSFSRKINVQIKPNFMRNFAKWARDLTEFGLVRTITQKMFLDFFVLGSGALSCHISCRSWIILGVWKCGQLLICAIFIYGLYLLIVAAEGLFIGYRCSCTRSVFLVKFPFKWMVTWLWFDHY